VNCAQEDASSTMYPSELVTNRFSQKVKGCHGAMVVALFRAPASLIIIKYIKLCSHNATGSKRTVLKEIETDLLKPLSSR
jgi:hypothetical protein